MWLWFLLYWGFSGGADECDDDDDDNDDDHAKTIRVSRRLADSEDDHIDVLSAQTIIIIIVTKITVVNAIITIAVRLLIRSSIVVRITKNDDTDENDSGCAYDYDAECVHVYVYVYVYAHAHVYVYVHVYVYMYV